MVEIGGRPILWHSMKIYAHYGVADFIICLGYRGLRHQGILVTIGCM
jgi:glucose-1-phosphate cytidylyltransferase